MKLNVGNLESFIRIFTGVWLTYAALHSYLGEWAYVGIVILTSGLSRFSLTKAILGLQADVDAPAHH